MDANQVTRPQARAIRSKVEPMREYLFRLRTRMVSRGFVPDDPLFELVRRAEQAIGELYVDVTCRPESGPVELPKAGPNNPLDRRSSRTPSGVR